MPSLFAYLIAVGLLLGGGYGALTWLAAPEPVNVVAKAKPTPRSHFDEASRETASEPSGQPAQREQQQPNPVRVGQSAQIAAASDQPPPVPPAAVSPASTAQGPISEVSAPAQVQPSPTVNAEVSSAEVGPPSEHAQAASTGSQTPAAAAKTVKPKPPHQQRLVSRSEKPALAMMTLRTIEYPDGRRVTQLLPYRGDDRD